MPADGGIRFGPFVLLRRIARGGMAEVFLAQQRGLEGFDRRVAVKRILPHLADSRDFVKMFLGEARLAAQLSHPNIVHIYDFGKVDHDYFIAMEYVEGVHTGQIFKHGEHETRMSPTLVARIGADAAAALHYAHELVGSNGKPLELVHRDVSPANIMVSYDGIVKLCDFGIAKAMALTDELTNPGQVKGKYAYMSPEQTVAAPLDGRSDVFSLAIVLWEMLTGRTIVPRGDAVDAMRAIRDGKLMPIDKAAPHTPAALAKAITWALETRREKRATAAELAQALEAFIKASPELATPMQLAQWVRTRFPRDVSDQHTALVDKGARPATGMAPRTAVAPGTVAGTGTKLGAVTPSSNLIAASVVSSPEDNAETIAMMSSSELASVTSQDDLGAQTVIDEPGDRPTMPRAATPHPHVPIRGADEPTVIAGDMTVHDTIGDGGETLLASGAHRPVMSAGPAVVPTRIQPRLELGSGGQRVPLGTDTTGVRPQPPRWLVPMLVFGGLVVVSFVIALLATRSGADEPDRRDASTPVVTADAQGSRDAAAIAGDAASAVLELDAAPARTAYVEVTTSPSGATVRIGDQVRLAPSSFALEPGTYKVVAELDGYQPERREVTVESREHRTYEIAFAHKLTAPRPPPPQQSGKLSVRTNPYSEVFHGGRKLGESPFEIDLPVGSYTLQFRNPSFPTATRTVKITAGRSSKVVFDLKR